jgi:type VI secretion system protein ImpA
MEYIDLNQLLKANSDAAPSGVDLEYDPLFGEMERAAKGREEQEFGDTLIAAEEPDWNKLKLHALAVLERSKDLRAAVQLIRSMIHTDGFAGLADGLSLIRGYIEAFWQSLYPQLDPDDQDDPTIRINTLLNLCDPVEILMPISKLSLVSSERMGQISHRDIQFANGILSLSGDEQREITLEQVEAAFLDAKPADLRSTRALIRQSIESASEIVALVSAEIGQERSFDLQPLLELLKAAEGDLADRTSPGDQSNPDAPVVQDVKHLTTGVSFASGKINNREDVMLGLDRICDYYTRYEPSSPVPLLLQRARRLVMMDFHEIVRDLAPEGQSHFEFLWRKEDG